jgi:hypothetical protein
MRACSIVVVIGFGVATACGSAAAAPQAKKVGSAPIDEGFTKARSSFGDFAARTLKITASHLYVSPETGEATVHSLPRVGGAWAFYGYDERTPAHEVRGWALADGTVVTPKHNLGRLLREAGVWRAQLEISASELAERIVWAMGPKYRTAGGVVLEVKPDGAGLFKFRAYYREPGPAYGPGALWQFTVKLTANQQAQLSLARAQAPDQEVLE